MKSNDKRSYQENKMVNGHLIYHLYMSGIRVFLCLGPKSIKKKNWDFQFWEWSTITWSSSSSSQRNDLLIYMCLALKFVWWDQKLKFETINFERSRAVWFYLKDCLSAFYFVLVCFIYFYFFNLCYLLF